jgi:hypothetical protein
MKDNAYGRREIRWKPRDYVLERLDSPRRSTDYNKPAAGFRFGVGS